MADKVPIRGAYNASSGLTGLANFASSETVGVAHGGTGIATVGSNQLVTGNGTSAMTSESNLTFDGSTLLVSGTASATSIMAADSGAALSSQNAKKIILVDLTDPGTMWDVKAFLARARYTSWYQESGIGAPPMRGAIWITEAQTSMVWWDLDTDSQFIKFDVGGSSNSDANMLYFSASSPPDSLVFLDGKIFYGATNGGGAWIIDFLRDECIGWFASGQRQYSGPIKERNDGNGNVATISTAIVNGTVNAVAAMRDPLSFDEFDRPKHWWSVGTAAGACIYNPHDDAIYDWSDAGRASTKQFMANGRWFFTRDQTTYTGVNYINGFGVAADQPSTIRHFNPWNSADNTNTGTGSFPWTVAATISDIAGNGDASRVFVSSDEGVCLITICEENQMYAWNWITSAYQTPYMKGTRVAAYPLNDVNDRSGHGLTLTNSNSTTFTSGPFGNTATFNGTNQTLYRTGDTSYAVGESDNMVLSCYFKSASATNPSASESLLYLQSANTTAYCQLAFNTSGGTLMAHTRNDSSGGTSITSTSPDFYDNRWHHVFVQWIYGDGLYLYVDGLQIAYQSGTGFGTAAKTFNKMYIGSAAAAGQYFDGQIAQVYFGKIAANLNSDIDVWSENEINLEYQRMVRGLGGATATLANSDVKSVRVDQNSGLAAITTAANQTEIWDIETGMRESIDATTTATINDADVRFKSGAILPEYITGRSGAIEFDGQERNVLG